MRIGIDCKYYSVVCGSIVRCQVTASNDSNAPVSVRAVVVGPRGEELCSSFCVHLAPNDTYTFSGSICNFRVFDTGNYEFRIVDCSSGKILARVRKYLRVYGDRNGRLFIVNSRFVKRNVVRAIISSAGCCWMPVIEVRRHSNGETVGRAEVSEPVCRDQYIGVNVRVSGARAGEALDVVVLNADNDYRVDDTFSIVAPVYSEAGTSREEHGIVLAAVLVAILLLFLRSL